MKKPIKPKKPEKRLQNHAQISITDSYDGEDSQCFVSNDLNIKPKYIPDRDGLSDIKYETIYSFNNLYKSVITLFNYAKDSFGDKEVIIDRFNISVNMIIHSDNPNYDKELEIYKKDLKKYTLDIKKYNQLLREKADDKKKIQELQEEIKKLN